MKIEPENHDEDNLEYEEIHWGNTYFGQGIGIAVVILALAIFMWLL